MAKVGTLLRVEAKEVSRARPSREWARIKILDLTLIWVSGWGVEMGGLWRQAIARARERFKGGRDSGIPCALLKNLSVQKG